MTTLLFLQWRKWWHRHCNVARIAVQLHLVADHLQLCSWDIPIIAASYTCTNTILSVAFLKNLLCQKRHSKASTSAVTFKYHPAICTRIDKDTSFLQGVKIEYSVRCCEQCPMSLTNFIQMWKVYFGALFWAAVNTDFKWVTFSIRWTFSLVSWSLPSKSFTVYTNRNWVNTRKVCLM